MKPLRLIALVMALGLSTYGQAVNVTANKIKGSATAPSGACTAQSVQLTTAGVLWTCASGTWSSSGGGGTTINSTNGQVPYRVNSTTFGDSAISSNALNATGISVTSAAAGSGVTIGVTSSGSSENLILTPKGSGVIEQRNGTNAQTLQVYNTYTDGSNNEWSGLSWQTNQAVFTVVKNGSGTQRNLVLGGGSNGALGGIAQIKLWTDGTIDFGGLAAQRWSISSSGHFLAATDSTYDIGQPGATRPRNIYAAASIIAGTGSALGIANKFTVYSNSDGTATITNAATTNFSRLKLGGDSASFPAIKRNGAALNFRVADDTADAAITASDITLSSSGVAISATSGTSRFANIRVSNINNSNNINTILTLTDSSANLLLATGASTPLLQFAGATSSFPALKRSSAELQVRLADDSGFAAEQSLYIRYGSGTPEGTVTAPVGAIYSRTDGGAGTSFYVKESGTGNTGWVAK